MRIPRLTAHHSDSNWLQGQLCVQAQAAGGELSWRSSSSSPSVLLNPSHRPKCSTQLGEILNWASKPALTLTPDWCCVVLVNLSSPTWAGSSRREIEDKNRLEPIYKETFWIPKGKIWKSGKNFFIHSWKLIPEEPPRCGFVAFYHLRDWYKLHLVRCCSLSSGLDGWFTLNKPAHMKSDHLHCDQPDRTFALFDWGFTDVSVIWVLWNMCNNWQAEAFRRWRMWWLAETHRLLYLELHTTTWADVLLSLCLQEQDQGQMWFLMEFCAVLREPTQHWYSAGQAAEPSSPRHNVDLRTLGMKNHLAAILTPSSILAHADANQQGNLQPG